MGDTTSWLDKFLSWHVLDAKEENIALLDLVRAKNPRALIAKRVVTAIIMVKPRAIHAQRGEVLPLDPPLAFTFAPWEPMRKSIPPQTRLIVLCAHLANLVILLEVS